MMATRPSQEEVAEEENAVQAPLLNNQFSEQGFTPASEVVQVAGYELPPPPPSSAVPLSYPAVVSQSSSSAAAARGKGAAPAPAAERVASLRASVAVTPPAAPLSSASASDAARAAANFPLQPEMVDILTGDGRGLVERSTLYPQVGARSAPSAAPASVQGSEQQQQQQQQQQARAQPVDGGQQQGQQAATAEEGIGHEVVEQLLSENDRLKQVVQNMEARLRVAEQQQQHQPHQQHQPQLVQRQHQRQHQQHHQQHHQQQLQLQQQTYNPGTKYLSCGGCGGWLSIPASAGLVFCPTCRTTTRATAGNTLAQLPGQPQRPQPQPLPQPPSEGVFDCFRGFTRL